jgi:hypothetical protein
MSIYTEIIALQDATEFIGGITQNNAQAAKLAINQILQRGGMSLIQQTMYSQIGFPSNYLSGDRLRVSKFATEKDLEGAILARKRATSLARFAAGGTPVGSRTRLGVRVQVKKGNSTIMKGAWLVRLNKGASLTEDQFNIGLAIRLKPGESVPDKHTTHQSWLIPGVVALLYGPSVDQVFRGVADQVGPKIGELVATEFFRQFARLA